MRLTNKCPTRSLAILRFALPAQVVKLVDTLASGASARKGVEVQVLSWAPDTITIERLRCLRRHRAPSKASDGILMPICIRMTAPLRR